MVDFCNHNICRACIFKLECTIYHGSHRIGIDGGIHILEPFPTTNIDVGKAYGLS